ncbi:MAG TPA: glycosyltransferase family 4 protein [Paludibaculum sp.]|jgi:glycosyltransferase involved in cell wall biosynthesis
MKIAITTPTNWPRVQRGGERAANELAAELATRGHLVSIVSGAPGPGTEETSGGVRTIHVRRWWHPLMGRFGLLEFHMFFFPLLFQLLRRKYDVVLCLTFMDAFAAEMARRFTKTPVILWLNGLPPRRQYIRSLSLKGAVFGFAVRHADEVIAVSGYVEDYLERRWPREYILLAPGVDTKRIRAKEHPVPDPPLILCAAALDDARKGGQVLMGAFNRLKGKRPLARLLLATRIQPERLEGLMALVKPDYRGDIEFASHSAEEMAELYRKATVTVLPSMSEPFGMVVIESLAAGTPVVCTRDGALPELITPEVGHLFDPGIDAEIEPTNSEGLADALDQCIDLAASPQTIRACRERGLQYSWTSLGDRYEELCGRTAGNLQQQEALAEQ